MTEACLAHSEADRVRASYNRAQFEAERRALLAKWGRFLLDTWEAAKVIALHR